MVAGTVVYYVLLFDGGFDVDHPVEHDSAELLVQNVVVWPDSTRFDEGDEITPDEVITVRLIDAAAEVTVVCRHVYLL